MFAAPFFKANQIASFSKYQETTFMVQVSKLAKVQRENIMCMLEFCIVVHDAQVYIPSFQEKSSRIIFIIPKTHPHGAGGHVDPGK